MRVEFQFYATLRDAVGEKTVTRDRDDVRLSERDALVLSPGVSGGRGGQGS